MSNIKLCKKSDLIYDNGYILNKDNMLMIPADARIISQLEDLDTMLQRARFIKNKPAVQEDVYFEREHIKTFDIESLLDDEPATPLHDKAEEEAKKLMDESDKISVVISVNQWLIDNEATVRFVVDSKVYMEERGIYGNGVTFDTPAIGNPLELTLDKLKEILYEIASINKD